MLRKFGLSMFASRLAIGLAMLAFGVPSVSAETPKVQKPGLLILNHGSPSPSWGKALKELTEKVIALNARKKTFHAVETAMMEFTQPDAAAGIEALEAAGCDRIIVVPLFIVPTSHPHFDVPAVLGLYSSPATRKSLLEEHHARIAAPRVPITLTQTMDEGELLDWYVETETRALSQNPNEEAVLLITHGDPTHGPIVDKVMNRLLVRACGSSGIASGQVADCAIWQLGQAYRQNVIPAIEKLSEQKKRILVVNVFVATSAKSLYEQAAALSDKSSTPSVTDTHDHGHDHGHHDIRACLEGIDVRFSEKGVIDHPKTPEWILQTASEAL